MPKTMLNWNIPVSRPRQAGGEISEMYSGAATVETPMPMPPMKRASMNDHTSFATADQSDPTRNRTPIQSSVCFRPNRSVGQPPRSEPTSVPQRAAPVARPCSSGLSSQSDWIVFSAPEMTTVSKPNRNPASADTTDQSRMREGMERFA